MTGLAAWRPPLAVIFALLGAQARPIAIFSRRSPPPPRLPPPPPPPMWLWSALVAAPPPPPLPPLLYRRPRAARSASRDASSTSTAGASTAALDPDPHGSNTSGDAHATGRSHRHDDDDTFVGAGGCGEHCRRSKGKCVALIGEAVAGSPRGVVLRALGTRTARPSSYFSSSSSPSPRLFGLVRAVPSI
jgi:hypothetical protein